MIDVQVAGDDDWRVWRALRLEALDEAPEAFGSRLEDWQGEGDREERWRGRLEIPGAHNLVVLVDGIPSGMASGVPGEQDGVVELISMWVAPAARGRGVGTALLDEVERWSRSVGAGVVRLDVAEGNAAATALYERHGYAFTGELGDLMADGVRRERVMEKHLSQSRHDED